MPEGRVDWYSANLGYGFIQPDDRDDQISKIFVRRENIKAGEEESLEDNDRVSYAVFEGPESLEAKGVCKGSGSSSAADRRSSRHVLKKGPCLPIFTSCREGAFFSETQGSPRSYRDTPYAADRGYGRIAA